LIPESLPLPRAPNVWKKCAASADDHFGDVKDLRLLREGGIAVFVWTVNEEAAMRSRIEQGVSGIFMDFPQRLRSVLDSRRNS
jgi:glycerophosphoryl diester phosphodiesterase